MRRSPTPAAMRWSYVALVFFNPLSLFFLNRKIFIDLDVGNGGGAPSGGATPACVWRSSR